MVATGRGRSASRSCAGSRTSSASARWSFAALLAIEVGKNRLEALGDVEETADLIRWSCDMVEQNDGFDHPMGNLGDATVHTRSVLKPYGVWAIISPFNFPFALRGGPSGGALVAGNTVVYKPSSDAPLSGVLPDAGLCATAACRTASSTWSLGPGETVGAELQENDGVDGILFTGSFEVGFDLYKHFAKRYPKPVIVEMGGKNPAIVSKTRRPRRGGRGRHARRRSASAARSARPTAGSTSSAPVYERFVELLADKTEAISVGDPTDRENWLGPVINQRAVARYEDAVAEARHDGRIAGRRRAPDR